MKYRRSMSFAAAMLLLCAGLTGCGKQESDTPAGQTVQAADLTADIKPQAVTGADPDETYCAGQTAFALKLMQETLKKQQDNVLISPYSVMQALAMTANGANGDTLAQMEQTLGGLPIADLNRYLYTVRTNQPNTEACKLECANSLWIRDDGDRIEAKPDFLQTTADYYGAPAYKRPFDQSTADEINSWCSEHTDGMIPHVISEIDETELMYLINAVVFDAKWEKQYENDPTDRDFKALDGSTQTAQMMYSDEHLYLTDAHACGFMKPYAGGKYAFAALLPEEGLSVTDYVAGLTPESLRKTLTGADREDVYAGLPEFTYDFDTEMTEQLSNMGMPGAFSEGADFRRMAKTDNGLLYIDKVLHKTHIEVDPKGTKAAAVTAVIMTNECDAETPEPKYVILDRPFLYMIVDTETGLPVFMGILTEIPGK
ncbi:MAG: serpin family protein [Oscillospiraceae bacterium]|nr:serpin family protein [Oscillospiraceae bacterium]